MASSSSSSSLTTQFKYDVFLNYIDVDVLFNFIRHLNKALLRMKIKTFIDDRILPQEDKIKTFIDDGILPQEDIPLSLPHAIEESKISVVVFSENYASSGWLLEELTKILEYRRLYGLVVIPVYYHVDPVDVRNQTGSFGLGFSWVEERFKENPERLTRWRDALKEATNISGFYSVAIWPESPLIEEIVEDIRKRLIGPTKLGWRLLSVFFLVMEAISVGLDVYGKSKKNFLLAAFVLSAFGFIITIYAFIRKRSTAANGETPERELAWVEVAFSVLQLVTLFIQYILAVAGVKNSYSPSLYPLVFALVVVVFAFKKKQISHSQERVLDP